MNPKATRRLKPGKRVAIDHLESRLCFSVSAATLAGPMTIGSTWNYSDGSFVTLNGPNAQSFDAIDVSTTTQYSYQDEYESFNAKGALVESLKRPCRRFGFSL